MVQHSELALLCRGIEPQRVALPDAVFHLIVFGRHVAGTTGETMRAQDWRRHRSNARVGAFCYASFAFCCPTALGAAGLFTAAPEIASVGSVLDGGALGLHHVTVDVARYPWSSIGKLFNSVGGACTAVVIAPDQVLTAAHCLYAFRTQRWLRADAIHFLLGYSARRLQPARSRRANQHRAGLRSVGRGPHGSIRLGGPEPRCAAPGPRPAAPGRRCPAAAGRYDRHRRVRPGPRLSHDGRYALPARPDPRERQAVVARLRDSARR